MEKNALNWSFPQLYMEYPHLHMELYGLYNMDYTQLTKDNQQLWLERHRPRLVKAFSFGAVGEGATATRFAKRSACAERLVICSSGMSQWNPETCKKKHGKYSLLYSIWWKMSIIKYVLWCFYIQPYLKWWSKLTTIPFPLSPSTRRRTMV